MGLIERAKARRLRAIAKSVVVLQRSSDQDAWITAYHDIPRKLRNDPEWRNAHIHEPYNRMLHKSHLRSIESMVFG